MVRKWFGAAMIGLVLGLQPGLAIGQTASKNAELIRQVDIPYEEFTLPNGLRVITHTDRKAPIVAVSIWYGVGSKDEPKGKTGFAHLFEHLMFNGSEHYNDEFFKPLENVGATDFNGTTWFDRTNYFENVPTPALELALFLESDRMGWLLGAVTKDKLDNQRGVVQNEKRQGDNEPYGLTEYAILEGLFPEGHPYRHSTIGSMADLNAASMADVQTWFKTHYGPNNAVLVLAGDIDAKTARPLVEKYFGNIPRGPEAAKGSAGVPDRSQTNRETMHDQVANARLYRVWTVPGRLDAQMPLLDVAATVLAGGPSSRLYNDLVRDKRLAVAVRGYVQPHLLTSFFQLEVDVKPGVDPAVVEKRLDELMAEFLAKGPTQDEVSRVATRAVAGTIRGLEQVGGFGGKATALAEGELYANDPGEYKKELQRYAAATPATVQAAAKRWIGDGDYRLTVLPGPREPEDKAKATNTSGGGGAAIRPRFYQQPEQKAATAPAQPTAKAGVDRSKLPEVKGFADLDFPDIQRAKLSNGIEVQLARRTTIPVVNFSLAFDAGNASDPKAKLGTSTLMLSLLDEGTPTRTAVQIAEESERLGAIIGAGASMDRTRASLSALKTNLQPSLDLFADIVRNPTFLPSELERVRAITLSRIAQEQTQPSGLALRELPPLLYGRDHPYGVPFTGSGTAEGVKSVTRDDLVAYHRTWIRPDNATLFVVGDTTMQEILPLLEKSFGDWKAPAVPKGQKSFKSANAPTAGRIVLLDRPGSPQSLILAGYPLGVKGTEDPIALYMANDILGGQFSSRLNTDLRETKGWAYGVGTSVNAVREQMPFILYAPVQTDKTADSIKALIEGMRAFTGDKPVTPEELARTINNNVRSLPGSFETAGDVLGGIERNALFGRPDDYQEKLAGRYQALTQQDLDAAADKYFDASKLTWVVVGDRAQVEAQLKALNIGPVEVRAAGAASVAK